MKILIISWLLMGACLGCQVPVFRYALERWRPDYYELKLSYHSIEKDLEQKLISLAASSSGKKRMHNLQLSLISQDSLDANRYQLIPPPSMRQANDLSGGVFTSGKLEQMIRSPKRQEILDHILSGDSAVWVMMLSGDVEKDAQARKMLENALAKAESEIKLPEGIIGNNEAALTEEEKENQLKSSIPLKIAFSIVEIDPNDPQEAIFVSMFTAGRPQASYAGKVVVAPVFGRGRSAGPSFAEDLDESKIYQACQYLCGACACGVKEENPGFDLLFYADWEKYLSDSAVIKDKPLADLSGFPVSAEVVKEERRSGYDLSHPEVMKPRNYNAVILVLVGLLIGVGVGFVTFRNFSKRRNDH